MLLFLFTACLFGTNVVDKSANDAANCASIVDYSPCNFSAINSADDEVERNPLGASAGLRLFFGNSPAILRHPESRPDPVPVDGVFPRGKV